MATASFQRRRWRAAPVDAHLRQPGIGADDRRRRRVGLGRRLDHGPRGARQRRSAAARVAIELTRFAGRSSASLTSATMTGVIAVAHTVPACQILETTVAAADGGDAATTACRRRARRALAARPLAERLLRRGGAAVRRVLGCDDIEVATAPTERATAGLARRGGAGEASPLF